MLSERVSERFRESGLAPAPQTINSLQTTNDQQLTHGGTRIQPGRTPATRLLAFGGPSLLRLSDLQVVPGGREIRVQTNFLRQCGDGFVEITKGMKSGRDIGVCLRLIRVKLQRLTCGRNAVGISFRFVILDRKIE